MDKSYYKIVLEIKFLEHDQCKSVICVEKYKICFIKYIKDLFEIMFSDVLCSLCPSSSKSSKKSGEFNFKYSLCINDLFIISTVIVDKDNIYKG